jgi:hypothetical protein
MSRFIDSFLKLYNIYYKNLYNNLNYLHRIKINCYHSITKHFYDISATDNEYIYDNYCCCCLNPKSNDIFIKMNCGHQMHFYCYKKFIKYKYNLCPFCKDELNKETQIDILDNEFKDVYLKEIVTNIPDVNFKYEINDLYYK